MFSANDMIKPAHFPRTMEYQKESLDPLCFQKQSDETLNTFLEGVEKEIIMRAFMKHSNTRDMTNELGISQPTLIRRLQKYRNRRFGIRTFRIRKCFPESFCSPPYTLLKCVSLKPPGYLSPKPNILSIPIWDERIKPNANMKSIDETKPASIKTTAKIYV